MPDWLAHILVVYILCSILGIKFKVFSKENTAIVMVGALIPDIVKVGLIFDFLGIDVWDFIAPLHTPVGSMLSAALFSLLFEEIKRKLIFSLLILGASTHFALDFLLMHVSGGMLLLFPFSWGGWQLGVIQYDNYYVVLLALIVACTIYVILKFTEAKKGSKR
jgi:hypothetical protein